jgi:hypothetical protein
VVEAVMVLTPCLSVIDDGDRILLQALARFQLFDTIAKPVESLALIFHYTKAHTALSRGFG